MKTEKKNLRRMSIVVTAQTKGNLERLAAVCGYTVNAIGRRLFGNGRIPHWTLNDAKLIVEYIKSISVEEDARRLSVLHDAVHDIMGDCKLDDADTRKRVGKDIHPVPKGGSTKW